MNPSSSSSSSSSPMHVAAVRIPQSKFKISQKKSKSNKRGHEEEEVLVIVITTHQIIMSNLLPSSSTFLSSSSFVDLLTLLLISLHLLFSLAATLFSLHFTHRHHPRPLLLSLNSLWPVRLLLVLFASLLSLSELLHLPLHLPSALCPAYSLSSHSLSQPAFFATLLFLLRSSVHHHPQPYSSSFLHALILSLFSALPFLTLHSLFLLLSPWALRRLDLPSDYLSGPQTSRCNHPLYGTILLALLGTLYVPVFMSACWDAVNVVINKRLRVRLYALSATVVVAMAAQVTSLAAASLWDPGSDVALGLGVVSYGAVALCAAVGEGILVVMPVIDALAIVETEEEEV